MSWVVPFGAVVMYLVALGVLALRVERRAGARAFARSPLAYALALCVYATAWSFYGSVGYAHDHGFGFLAINLGVALSMLAIPFLWNDIARITERHRLASVADLLAFRFPRRRVGATVTAFMLAGMIPYIALQLRAVSDSAAFISGGAASERVGVLYAAALALFAALVGARFADPRHKRPGLLGALAAESIVKLGAMAVVGVAALFAVFGGPDGLSEFLATRPAEYEAFVAPVNEASWPALVFASFFAAFLLPRQFHIAFVERPSEGAMRHAMWIVPAYLLLLNLPVPVLYWAGSQVAGAGVTPDTYVLAAVESPWVRFVAFIGGVSASSAMLLVSSMALSGMVVTHMILPLTGDKQVTPARIVGLRRGVIVGLVSAGFLFHVLLPRGGSLVDLGIISFAAVLQLAPGVLCVLWWRRATTRGVMWGIGAGGLVWVLYIVPPLMGAGDLVPIPDAVLPESGDPRSIVIWLSFFANVAFLAFGTLSAEPGEDERAAALAISPTAGTIAPIPRSVDELRERLEPVFGEIEAAAILADALDSSGIVATETRPMVLAQLTRDVETRVTPLVGPLAARAIVESESVFGALDAVAAEMHFLETRAAALDETEEASGLIRSFELVRRYLSGLLDTLPIGVCAFDEDGRVAVWNESLATLSCVEREDVLGSAVDQLQSPWHGLLRYRSAFRAGHERRITTTKGAERIVWVQHVELPEGGHAAVVADLTAERAMQSRLAHEDRLMSIGRLASGIAHEIGNPLTGVLMVARNLERDLEEKPGRADAPERLATIVEEAQRIEVIVKSLLGFARKDALPTSEEDDALAHVADAADAMQRLVHYGRNGRGVEVTCAIHDDAMVRIREQHLVQVLVNLVSNAIDASRDGARVDVRADVVGVDVLIDVLDRGEGISREIADSLFEPFVTTRAPGEGTGLGLAVVYWIVDEAGGTLAWSAREGGGTRFRVTLPHADATPRMGNTESIEP